MFALLLIEGEMKYNFVLQVVGIKRPIKKCKQKRATSMLEAIILAFIEEVLN